MNVSKEGVKGYEYQYKATVLIALLYVDFTDSELYVEIKGGEDALLQIRDSEAEHAVEIQVKRERKQLTIDTFIKWLTHFQERSHDNNLLSRISSENDRIALFITNSRSSDDLVVFLKRLGQIEFNHEIEIDKSKIVRSLKDVKLGTTRLFKKREEFCQKQSKEFENDDSFKSVFSRIFIWEEISDEKIDHEILSILNVKHRIAISNALKVYLVLLELVKEGRDRSINILPSFLSTLQKNRIGRPMLDEDYQARKIEPYLGKKLENESVVLLTGISLCGKTEIAKKLASELFNRGYNYLLTSELEEVERFFSTSISDTKVAILEDPFGHSKPHEGHYEKVRKLESIIKNIQSHHRLLVTSRSEILLEVYGETDVDKCVILNHEWNNVTLLDSDELIEYWSFLVKKRAIPEKVFENIQSNLNESKGTHLLQLGQLSYLANQDHEKLLKENLEGLDLIARHNSKEILFSIKEKSEYFAEVLFVLSICSDTIQHIEYNDLAYILSQDEERPSISSSIVTIFSYDNEDPPLPDYPQDYNLSTEAIQSLEYLQDRGLIDINDENIRFSHPNYLQSGKQLYLTSKSTKRIRLLEYLERVISCLNFNNAYIGASSFHFLFQKAEEVEKEKIIRYTFQGLNSIFPSVQDRSLIFLVDLIDVLSDEQTRTLLNAIQSGGASGWSICWHKNEIPFISRDGGSSPLRYFSINDDVIQKVESLIEKGKLPSAYQTWLYLEKLRAVEPNIKGDDFIILLQHNESFIRNKVAFASIQYTKSPSENLLQKIFEDEHPSVIFSGIRAILNTWNRHSLDLKKRLLLFITEALTKRGVAIRTFNLMSTFSIDYSSEAILWRDLNEDEKRNLWLVWGDLYPLVMKDLPIGLKVNTARFAASMDEAFKFLDIPTGMQVLESWLARIDYQIQNDIILDEFELCIGDLLMKLTQDNHDIRKNIFSRLINYQDTSFILSNLKWIVEYWDQLDISEKTQIVSLLESDREDLRWIKAVLLNAYSPPPKEITQAILAVDDLDKDNARRLLPKFPDQLLGDCLNVYCGFPQPLWWLAVHHHNKEFWGTIIRIVLEDENNIGFDTCLHEFVSHGVNGFGEEWNDWMEIWKNLCLNTKKREVLVESLIYNVADSSCDEKTTHSLWTILIESYSKINKEDEMISHIVGNIELLQQTGDKEDIYEFFSQEFLDKIIGQVYPDNTILNFLRTCELVSDLDDEKIELMKILMELIHGNHIRFFLTFDYIKYLNEKKAMPEEIMDELLRIPNKIDQIGQSMLKEKHKLFEYKLDNWIGIN